MGQPFGWPNYWDTKRSNWNRLRPTSILNKVSLGENMKGIKKWSISALLLGQLFIFAKPIHAVVWHMTVEEIVKNKLKLDAIHSSGHTFLTFSLCYNELRKAQEFLAAGANVNARDINGFSPLAWAVYRGHLDMMRTLLEAGADINAKSLNDETVLAVAYGSSEEIAIIRKWSIKKQIPISDPRDKTILDGEVLGSFQKEFDDFGLFLIDQSRSIH